ncbi:hypothetical protein [Chondromyces apiculatus]|uniref:thiopurine S-methyltransferase n=1 Tax=Chondromyces apiculatus DSM 436 TaxID=1192034 RepID=A0A017SV56_9BACT|nr:hypothetical protein [Chondromyces apiculatus]EYF00632.1 Thiopurine S-methyltransferase [Chondromyces apiculatus DSM 436]
MQAEFWFDSWERGGFYTSFHRRDIHPFVERHTPAERFAGAHVLVPLCGKTNDMLYYRQFARHVTGVELVEKAILQFFTDNSLDFVQKGNRFEGERITLLCADFLSLEAEDVGQVDLVYDRASLVAMPLEMRLNYLRTLDRLTPVGAQQLLNTLEYDPVLPSAPFSIAPEEVVAYYADGYDVSHVEATVVPQHGMVRRWGLRFLMEHGFMLTKRRNLRPELLEPRLHEALAQMVLARNRRLPELVETAGLWPRGCDGASPRVA